MIQYIHFYLNITHSLMINIFTPVIAKFTKFILEVQCTHFHLIITHSLIIIFTPVRAIIKSKWLSLTAVKNTYIINPECQISQTIFY